MANRVIIPSDNDWTGNTSYYTTDDGTRIGVPISELEKFNKENADAGRKVAKVPTLAFTDRQGSRYVVPEDRVQDFLYEQADGGREVAEIREWQNAKGERMPITLWKDSGKEQEVLRGAGFKPAEEWNADENRRPTDFINAVNHAFTHAEDWGVTRDPETGKVDWGDSAKEVGTRAVQGVRGAVAGIGMGAAGMVADAALNAAALGSRALGNVAEVVGADRVGAALKGWQAPVRREVEEFRQGVRDALVDEVMGEAITQGTKFGRDLAMGGLGAAETYGEMALGLKAIGKAGKAAVPAAFGVGGMEQTLEDEQVAEVGKWGATAVATARGLGDALMGSVLGKVMHAVGAKGAKKPMAKTFGKALALALGETVEGGLAMGGMAAVDQAARGIAGVADKMVDADGNPTDDPEKAVGYRQATVEERVGVAENALLHGTLMTLGLKAAELSPRLFYSGRGMTKAVSYDVEMARKQYAPNVARVAEAARGLQEAGNPLPNTGAYRDVKGVSTNGEVYFKDGSVYYPEIADRDVPASTRDGRPGIRTVKGRPARIVVSDGTILDVKGNVVGKTAGGQRLATEAETQAEAYVRATDPEAANAVTVFDRATGRAADLPADLLEFAPEAYRKYNQWVREGGTTPAPELDAESLAFGQIVGRLRLGGDARHAAEMALGDIRAGRKTAREAADLLNRVAAQIEGRELVRVRTENSVDTPDERVIGVTAPVVGRTVVETRPGKGEELPRTAVDAAADLHELGKIGEIKPETVDVTEIDGVPEKAAAEPAAAEPAGSTSADTKKVVGPVPGAAAKKTAGLAQKPVEKKSVVSKIKPNAKRAAAIVKEFVASGGTRLALKQVYHDKKKGVAVATNKKIIIATKEGFDKNAADVEGYPDWEIVIPKDKDVKRSVTVDPKELAKNAKKAIDLGRVIVKGSDLSAVVVLDFGGKRVMFDSKQMRKFADAMTANGITEIGETERDGGGGPIRAKNKRTTIAMMPIRDFDYKPGRHSDNRLIFIDGHTGRIISAPERTNMDLKGLAGATRGGYEDGLKEELERVKSTPLFLKITGVQDKGITDPKLAYDGMFGEGAYDSRSPKVQKQFAELLKITDRDELAARLIDVTQEGKTIKKNLDTLLRRAKKYEKLLAAEDEIDSLMEQTGQKQSEPAAADKQANGEKAPVFVRRNPETGRMETVDGGKRIAAEKANGAKTVEAVVLHEEDGWTPENAEAVKLVGNVTSGSLDAKGLVDAFGKLGLSEAEAIEKGLIGTRKAPRGETTEQALPREGVVDDKWLAGEAERLRRLAALRVAQEADAEVKAAVVNENLMQVAGIVGKINSKTFGDGWREAQRAALADFGELGTAQLKTALDILRKMSPYVRARKVELRELVSVARYFAENGEEMLKDGIAVDGMEGFRLAREKMAKDSVSRVPVEKEDGSLSDVGREVGAREGRADSRMDGTGKAADLKPKAEPGLEPRAVGTNDGGTTFAYARFPEMRVVIGDGVISVIGVDAADMTDSRSRYDMAKIVGRLSDMALEKKAKLRFPPGTEAAANDLIDFYESSVKTDAATRERAERVIGILEKSGLATEVVTDEDTFRRALADSPGGSRLVADGLTYGWTLGGKVYLDPKFFGTKAGLNTPIHEFGHLAWDRVKRINPALYARGMELAGQMKEQIDALRGEKGYDRYSEEALKEEILVKLIGDRGEAELMKSAPKTLVESVRKWVEDVWRAFGGAMGIADLTEERARKMTIEEIADAVNAEMTSGRKFGERRVEGYERLNRKVSIEDVTAPSGPFAVKRLDSLLRNLSGKDMENAATGMRAQINAVQRRKIESNAAVRKSEANGFTRDEHNAVASMIENLWKIAEPAVRHPDKSGETSVAVHRFVSLAHLGEREVFPYLTVKQTVMGGTRIYSIELEKIETLEGTLKDRGLSSSSVAGIVSRLRAKVNGEGGDVRLNRAGGTAEQARPREEEGYERLNRPFFGEGKETALSREDVTVDPKSATLESTRKSLKALSGKRLLNLATGIEAQINAVQRNKIVSSKAIAKSKANGFTAQEHNAAASIIDRLWKNAELVESRGDIKNGGDKNIRSIKRFVSLVYLGDREGAAYITAKESVRDGHRIYSIELEELRALEGKLKGHVPSASNALETPEDNLKGHVPSSSSVEEIVSRLRAKVNGDGGDVGLNRAGEPAEQARPREEEGYARLNRPFFGEGKETAFNRARAGMPNSSSGASDSLPGAALRHSGPRYVEAARIVPKDGKFVKGRVRQFNNGDMKVDIGRPVGAVIKSVSKVLDLRHRGSFNSYYNVFNTPAGTVAFRLSGHSANGENFARDKADRNTSVVIEMYEWKGKETDVPYEEIVYPRAVFEANREKVVKAIVNGFGRMLETGSFEDSSGLAIKRVNGPKYSRAGTGGTAEQARPHEGRGERPVIEFVDDRARVANDEGRGESTPGAIAASRELSTQATTPIRQAGRVRRMSLPISDMEWLRKKLTGNNVPAHVAKRLPGGAASASTRAGKLVIAADVFGIVDRTDMAAQKDLLKQHGYYRHEDPAWLASALPGDIRREKRRSEEQLANQLESLGRRRVAGQAGGESAARAIYADELANIVMEMKSVPANGTAARVRTIGDGIRKSLLSGAGGNFDAIRDEAGQFLDWAYGTGETAEQARPREGATRDLPAEQLTNRMFGAFLVMPQEVAARAPRWSAEMANAIASDRRLLDAWQELSFRAMFPESAGHLAYEISRSLDRQTEQTIAALEEEGREPIRAKGKLARAKEAIYVGFDDRMAPVAVRIGENAKFYRRNKLKLIRETKDPAARAALESELARFEGAVGAAMNRMELSRLAYERGAFNEGRAYFLRELMLVNEMTERKGITIDEMATYLDMNRVIETQGRAASRGMTPRQAQLTLDAMRKRLGSARWADMQGFAAKWWAIHEQEFLRDPRLERAMGRAYVDYLETQTHYVTAARTWSPEELEGIRQAREMARRSGVAGGDDVVGQMFAYASRFGGMGANEGVLTGRLVGSFADKKNVMAATWDKVDRAQKFLRRNQYVMDLRDALLAAGVEGVRDVARGDREFREGPRYGILNYMENGQKRTLVVPRQIADGFQLDPGTMTMLGGLRDFWRTNIIDRNPAYWNRNVNRNIGSIEKNMPGMRESWVKTVLRPLGLGNVSDTVLTHLCRHASPVANLFGEATVFAQIPRAKRIADIIQDPSGWQQRLWRAEDAKDVEAVAAMRADLDDALKVLKANMLVPLRVNNRGGSAGFVDDVLGSKAMRTIARIREEQNAKGWGRKAWDAVDVFEKNRRQQQWEDDHAKIIAYLHDRMKFGGVRTEAESGRLVAENVSIGQGERSGKAKGLVQGTVATFWNMTEKGFKRYAKAHMDRPGEMAVKDAKVVLGAFAGNLVLTGVASAVIRKMFDDDEKKILESPLGTAYRYCEMVRRARKNMSQYVRENYNAFPIWLSPSGKTSIVLGMPWNDEDKQLAPVGRYMAEKIAERMGITAEHPSATETAVRAATVSLAPDNLALSGPEWTLLRDTVWAMFWDNPTDAFTGAKLYDQETYDLRGASAEMMGKFGWAMAKQVWNDMGGRIVLQADRNEVEGKGEEKPEEPGFVDVALRKLPIASPFIRSFVKVQTGDVDKYAKALTKNEKMRKSLINTLCKWADKKAVGDEAWPDRDPDGFEKQVGEWKKTYEMTDDEEEALRAQIEKRSLDRFYSEYQEDRKREKIEELAERQGVDARYILD